MVTHPEVFLRPESRLVVAVLPRHEQILQAAARENHEVDSVWRHLQNPNKLLDEESPGEGSERPNFLGSVNFQYDVIRLCLRRSEKVS